MKPAGVTRYQWWRYNLYFLAEHFTGLKFSEKHFRKGKTKLFNEIAQNKSMKERGEVLDLHVVDSTNGNFVMPDKAVMNKEPIVFKGAASDWPCMKEWTESFFEEKRGQYNIELIDNVGLAEESSEFRQTDMASFVKEMKKNKTAYLRFSRIIDDYPELKKDLDLKWLHQFRGKKPGDDIFFLFMGEAGTKTGMHNALPPTLFAQIKGEKRWVIYPPEERIFLDPVAARMTYHYTHAIPGNLNDERYPLLGYAKRYEIFLEEGDVLWFPSFYWHYVENVSTNIGVAYKYLDLANAFRNSKVMGTLFFLRTKPSIIHSILYNKKKNYDVLHKQKGKKPVSSY